MTFGTTEGRRRYVDLQDLAKIYSELIDHLERTVPTWLAPPRDTDLLLSFVSAYTGVSISVLNVDFGTLEHPDIPIDDFGQLLSMSLIYEHDGDADQRSARIIVNGSRAENGDPVLTPEWYRFSIAKEACQLIVLRYLENEKFSDMDNRSFSVRDLALNIVERSNVPFSLSDFNAPYELQSLPYLTEMAAQVIAFMVLVDVDEILALKDRDAPDELPLEALLDLQDLVNKWQVPERFLAAALTSPEIGYINGLARAIRDGALD